MAYLCYVLLFYVQFDLCIYANRYETYDSFSYYVRCRACSPKLYDIISNDRGYDATVYWQSIIALELLSNKNADEGEISSKMWYFYFGYLHGLIKVNAKELIDVVSSVRVTRNKVSNSYSSMLVIDKAKRNDYLKKSKAKIGATNGDIVDSDGIHYDIPEDIVAQPLLGNVASCKTRDNFFVAIYSDHPTRYTIMKYNNGNGKCVATCNVWGYTNHIIYRGSFNHMVSLSVRGNSLFVIGLASNCFYVEEFDATTGRPLMKISSYLPQ